MATQSCSRLKEGEILCMDENSVCVCLTFVAFKQRVEIR